MDLIMGSFADTHVPGFSADELALYEELLHTPDPDIYDWITGQKTPPVNILNSVLNRLLSHDYAAHRRA